MAYDGQPLTLKICYQQLKNIIRRPAVSYSTSTQEKPHYMKMTFAMSRSAAPNSKILEIQSMLGQVKAITDAKYVSTKKIETQSQSDMTLLRQLKGSLGSLLPQD